MHKEDRQVRYAVIGLGHFAQSAILPAFANAADNSVLGALVTADAEKAVEVGKRYHVPSCGYDDLEDCLSRENIDAVYIAVPNAKHREFAVRAAKRRIHVLCEKPLAHTVADCQAMIDACKAGSVHLMTAYRLHFEEGNLDAIETIRSGRIGEPRLFNSIHTMQVEADNVRIDSSLGGGPLEDIGVYCINAARYLFRAEPQEVYAVAAKSADPRFTEVPEAVSATLRFPCERLAAFLCGFGEAKASYYRVLGTKGSLIMDPAFTWSGEIRQTLIVGENEKSRKFSHRDQVAAELLYFSKCVQEGQIPEPSGLEGLIDVEIIEALRASYSQGRPVSVQVSHKRDRPDESQSIERPPPAEPEPVNASPPAKGR